MIDKAFVEITNICNLNCDFCTGHTRKNQVMSPDEFLKILKKLDGKIKYLYLHLMGEPLTHPHLSEILRLADGFDFRVMLTTNGTLLEKVGDTLLSCEKLFKVSISVHSFEGNKGNNGLDEYLDSCIAFADKAKTKGVITVFRLWNRGGKDSFNEDIIRRLHTYSTMCESVPAPNRSGERLSDKVFIEWGDKFDWPEDSYNACDTAGTDESAFCYALRDQFGILVDGSVVPCCLDSNGRMVLGNIFESELDEILSSSRARAIYDGFTVHRAVEDLCKSCERGKIYRKKQQR